MSDEPVRLTDVTRENYLEVLRLKVAEHQQGFVATNEGSVAQSKFHPEYHPRAIYRGDTAVGFLMYGPFVDDEPAKGTIIFRLMVDQRWQGEGIGRAALYAAIEEIQRAGGEPITIGYKPENEVAKGLYASVGFVESHTDEDGEVIAEFRS